MKAIRLLLTTALMLFVLSSFVVGCSKEELDDTTSEEFPIEDVEGDDGSASDDNYNDDDDEGINPPQRKDTLSVSEFIEGNFEGGAFVEGYIVGACTKSFKYAQFTPPFSNPQALLIADKRNERDKYSLLAVELKQGKIRKALNLVDHPQYLGRKVLLFGYRATYLYMAGMKDVGAYKVE